MRRKERDELTAEVSLASDEAAVIEVSLRNVNDTVNDLRKRLQRLEGLLDNLPAEEE